MKASKFSVEMADFTAKYGIKLNSYDGISGFESGDEVYINGSYSFTFDDKSIENCIIVRLCCSDFSVSKTAKLDEIFKVTSNVNKMGGELDFAKFMQIMEKYNEFITALNEFIRMYTVSDCLVSLN